MTRPFDPYKEDEEELREELIAGEQGGDNPFSIKSSLSDTVRTKVLVKKARNKSILKSMENPFEDDTDIMQYLDRAIDNSRSPLDQLELKMLHESLCREIRKEKFHKKSLK